jgi:hypothetical protein
VSRFRELISRPLVLVALVAVPLLALVAKQVVTIAEHGVVGWLEGEGAGQTEWEVRAVLLVTTLLLVLVVALLWRAGESVAEWIKVTRLTRAIRRGRRAAADD